MGYYGYAVVLDDLVDCNTDDGGNCELRVGVTLLDAQGACEMGKV